MDNNIDFTVIPFFMNNAIAFWIAASDISKVTELEDFTPFELGTLSSFFSQYS